MRTLLFALISGLFVIPALAQQSYIQVTGEPNLSVFLNNQFKGKTTLEYKGYIIENVNSGTNVIKIVKEGYGAVEETVDIKAGEVFAYKVKPFVKHEVTISQQGSAAEPETKKEAVKMGKLIIQSLPIEIKISIPGIDGLRNSAKIKDEWIVNDIPVGTYDIEFSFGNKTVKRNVSITEGDVTSAFMNMMSSEFNAKIIPGDEKEMARNQDYIMAIVAKYGYKAGLSFNEFFSYNKEAAKLQKYPWNALRYQMQNKHILKSPQFVAGPRSIMLKSEGIVGFYTYAISGFTDYTQAQNEYKRVVNEFKQDTNPKFIDAQVTDNLTEFYAYSKSPAYVIRYSLQTIAQGRYEIQLLIKDL